MKEHDLVRLKRNGDSVGTIIHLYPDGLACEVEWTGASHTSTIKLDELELNTTFDISVDGKSITCRACGMESFHPKDIEERYCGKCHVFHDDIWPPARKWWIEQGKKP